MHKPSPPPGAPNVDVDARGADRAGAAGEGHTGRHRRRFGEGETMIMRLDELLRTRPGLDGAAAPSGDKTQVVSLGDLQVKLSHQTERTIRGGNLSAEQVALLQRTEPKASAQHTAVGAPPAPPADSVWAPRAQPSPATAGAGPDGDADVGSGARTATAPAPAARAPAPAPPSRAPTPTLVDAEASAPGVATRIGPPPVRWPAAPAVPSPPAVPPAPPAERDAASSASATPAATSDWASAVPRHAPAAPRAGAAAAGPRAIHPRDAQTDPGLVLPAQARASAAPPASPPASSPNPADAALAPAPKPSPRAQPGPARGKRRVTNQVVVVFSCKGGAGATALAANAAFAAASRGQAACVLDLDLQLGDALASFGLAPRFSIAQAIALLQERQSLTRTLLPSHAGGVHVLSQVGNLNDLDKITPETMGSLLLALRQHFDVVFVDGVRDFGDNALAMLDSADKVAIVCVQEVLAIRRARWTFGILRKIGFEAADITLVLNRFTPNNEIPLSSVSSMFEGAQVAPLAGDATLVTQSLNRGVPLAELRGDHPLVADVGRLSDHLLYDDAFAGPGSDGDDAADGDGDAAAGGRGFFRRMFKGKAPRNPT